MSTLMALIGPLLVHSMFRRAGVGKAPPPIAAHEYVRAFLAGRRRG